MLWITNVESSDIGLHKGNPMYKHYKEQGTTTLKKMNHKQIMLNRLQFHKQILYYLTLENVEIWNGIAKLAFHTEAARWGHTIKVKYGLWFSRMKVKCPDCFKKKNLPDLFKLYLLTGEFLSEVVLFLLQPVDLFLLAAELQFGGLGPITLNRRAICTTVGFARAHVKGPFHSRWVAEIKRESWADGVCGQSGETRQSFKGVYNSIE